MSDSSRKYLWIGVAVSLFALIVVGGVYLFFPPDSAKSGQPFSLGGDVESKPAEPADFLADEPASAGTGGSSTANDDIIIVYGNEPAADTNAKGSVPASTTIMVAPQTPTTTPVANAAPPAVTPATTTTTVKPAAVAQKSVSTTTTAKAASTPKTAAATSTTTAASTATPPATQSATASAGDWWIQAGLFGNKANAVALQNSIASKNLPAQIAEKVKSGATMYQVRVGPYPSSEEAKKWLASVKSVQGAEAAWLTQ